MLVWAVSSHDIIADKSETAGASVPCDAISNCHMATRSESAEGVTLPGGDLIPVLIIIEAMLFGSARLYETCKFMFVGKGLIENSPGMSFGSLRLY